MLSRPASKKLIEGAHDAASASCMTEHEQRRLLAVQSLAALTSFARSCPTYFLRWMELAFAALAFAGSEIRWHFLHVDEVMPRRPI